MADGERHEASAGIHSVNARYLDISDGDDLDEAADGEVVKQAAKSRGLLSGA